MGINVIIQECFPNVLGAQYQAYWAIFSYLQEEINFTSRYLIYRHFVLIIKREFKRSHLTADALFRKTELMQCCKILFPNTEIKKSQKNKKK